jgi:hypothetical protein
MPQPALIAPLGQVPHATHDVFPGKCWNRPDGHEAHEPWSAAGWILPAAQSAQSSALAPLYFPMLQPEHSSAPVALWNWPDGHALQYVDASEAWYLPISHTSQCSASDVCSAEADPNLPAEHAAQVTWPVAAWYLPTAQLWHAIPPVALL